MKTKEKVRLAKAYNNKGIALMNLELYDECLECFDKALNIPGVYYQQALLNKGIALSEMGKDLKAVMIFDELIEELEDELKLESEDDEADTYDNFLDGLLNEINIVIDDSETSE